MYILLYIIKLGRFYMLKKSLYFLFIALFSLSALAQVEFSKGHDFDSSDEVPFIRRWIRGSEKRLSRADRASLVELA